jgi:phosphoglycerate dehydrogenase-like enzyme
LRDDRPFHEHTTAIRHSPHFAGAGGRASVERLAAGVIENLERLRAGQALAHCVSAG